jgi:hypothetical protein
MGTEVPVLPAEALREELPGIISMAFEMVDDAAAAFGAPRWPNSQLVWGMIWFCIAVPVPRDHTLITRQK